MRNLSPILIAYDGSDNARYAVEKTGEMLAFAGLPVLVLYAWEAAELAAIRRGIAGMSTAGNEPDTDAESSAFAQQIANAGTELARKAGLDAEPRTAYGSGPVWETIARVADEEDASLIVLGSRGLHGLRSLMLGSVSHQITHHARQPVLIVPTPALADARWESTLQQADVNGVA